MFALILKASIPVACESVSPSDDEGRSSESDRKLRDRERRGGGGSAGVNRKRTSQHTASGETEPAGRSCSDAFFSFSYILLMAARKNNEYLLCDGIQFLCSHNIRMSR